uniref:Uncharacterized protein n=1 Tax=Glossina pallidipes TaxID=7398 RepID=A0A1A9ZDG1_GLOPL
MKKKSKASKRKKEKCFAEENLQLFCEVLCAPNILLLEAFFLLLLLAGDDCFASIHNVVMKSKDINDTVVVEYKNEYQIALQKNELQLRDMIQEFKSGIHSKISASYSIPINNQQNVTITAVLSCRNSYDRNNFISNRTAVPKKKNDRGNKSTTSTNTRAKRAKAEQKNQRVDERIRDFDQNKREYGYKSPIAALLKVIEVRISNEALWLKLQRQHP